MHPTLDDFAALRGESFSLRVDDGPEAELQVALVEAQPLPMAPIGARQPFSLIFAGPALPVLPQRIYKLAHARLPGLDVFLVPVAADSRTVRYQAVFT